MDHFSLPALVLTGLLLALAVAYVFHYYRLENTVQRWYSISNRIRRICKRTNKGKELPRKGRGVPVQIGCLESA